MRIFLLVSTRSCFGSRLNYHLVYLSCLNLKSIVITFDCRVCLMRASAVLHEDFGSIPCSGSGFFQCFYGVWTCGWLMKISSPPATLDLKITGKSGCTIRYTFVTFWWLVISWSVTFGHHVFSLHHLQFNFHIKSAFFIPQCWYAPVKSYFKNDSRFIRTKLQLCVDTNSSIKWMSFYSFVSFRFSIVFACICMLRLWLGHIIQLSMGVLCVIKIMLRRWEFFVVFLRFFVTYLSYNVYICLAMSVIFCVLKENYDFNLRRHTNVPKW